MSTNTASFETKLEVSPIVTLNKVTTLEPTKLATMKSELDLNDTTSVISWGIGSQRKVSDVSQEILKGVKSKDAGEVGDQLVAMVTQIRGLDFSKVQPGKEVGFFGKLFGKVTPIAEFIQSYEEILTHVNAVRDNLETKKLELATSVKQLDALYKTTVEYFHNLADYITAGELILKEMDEITIPAMKAAAGTEDLIKAQELNDFVAKRDMFDRRVHDLKLTRQVTMQTIPGIRMIQRNDTDLITKIDTQIINTLPAWELQLAMAVKMWQSADAAKDSKQLSDMQNDTLMRNAEMLKMANSAARTEVERGAYDIEAIKKSNDTLIAAIEESINIAQQGKQARIAAAAELVTTETKLKEALAKAA
jgi:uncharacterized protein YaaN involved in tellurite resistance